MRTRHTVLVVALGIAACDSNSPETPPTLEFADGAIQVREIEPRENGEKQFEIIATTPGRLTATVAPSGFSLSIPIKSVPDQRVIRIVREEFDGERILDNFIAPLFGAETADDLRNRQPEASDRRLVSTRIIVENEGGFASMGPSVAALPSPGGGSGYVGLWSRQPTLNQARVRLAAWLDLPRSPDGLQPMSMGIADDGPRITQEGRTISVEEAGGVYTELTLEFEPETVSLAAN